MCTENFHFFPPKKSDKLWQVSGGLIAHLPPQNTLPAKWSESSEKSSKHLISYISMTYKVIKCIEITQNIQILKIAEFAI